MHKILEAEVQNSEYSKQNKSFVEKELLLDAYDQEQKKVKNISWQTLLLVYLTIFFTLLVILPKIYISNQIYYTSKDINSMYQKYTALKEENAHLKRELEMVRYQVEVLDELDPSDSVKVNAGDL